MNPSRLIDLRKKLNLSQREMASEFGVSAGAIAMWEKGQRPIPGLALKIIEIYEETLNEELALQRQNSFIRELSTSWSKRLLLTIGKGSKGKKKELEGQIENSLETILKHELSNNQIKRNIQVSLIERLINAVSQTKGLPMKFVQMLTYLQPNIHPKARSAIDDIFNLQYPMAPTIAAKIVAESLGSSPHKLFSEWSSLPVATASIGQVHRARLKSGEEIAVKLQYPDIKTSIHKDLNTFSFIGELSSLLNAEVKQVLEGIKETVINETDYRKELAYLQEFQKIFKDDPHIIIPKVYPEYSSDNVITMEYIEGKALQEFKHSSVEARTIAAETIARFTSITTFKNGIMNTDAHAGNFLFCENGKVAFLDFGRCARTEDHGEHFKKLLKAVILRDRDTAKRLIAHMRFIKKPETFDFDRFWNFFMTQQLHLHSGKFRFTHDYIKKTMEATKAFDGKDDLKLTLDFIWSSTISFGTWSIFADLDVEVDYGQISLEALST